MINGQEEIRRGLAAKSNDSATRSATVNTLSYVTSREDDTNPITKTINPRRFLFPFLGGFFILVRYFPCATLFMIIPFALSPLV